MIPDASALRLRPLRVEDHKAALAAHEELRADGFLFLLAREPGESWADYVERRAAHGRGQRLAEGFVPETFLGAFVDDELVGRVSIRHELSEFLAREGGHIGYGIRPHARGRGYATEVLRQSLVIARSHGVDRVLITCDDDNVASATVIERCGGVFEDLVDSSDGDAMKRRYWIA